MRASELLRVAFEALRVNRMRSLLTMLGVIIGVAAVIAMVALVLFIIVHLALVILAGAWNEVRSMITGRFTVPGHVPAHTGEDAA